MIHIVVIFYQGIITDVQAFTDPKEAADFFKDQTEVSWEEFKRRVEDEDTENILGDRADSYIFDVELTHHQGKEG